MCFKLECYRSVGQVLKTTLWSEKYAMKATIQMCLTQPAK